MTEAAELKESDVIYDLGCGDGRLAIEAAGKYGVLAFGVERSFFVWLLAGARKFLYRSNATILRKNMFEADLSGADAVFCYLIPEMMGSLKEKLEKELPRGAKVVSRAFKISGWRPVREITHRGNKKISPILVYEMGKSDI